MSSVAIKPNVLQWAISRSGRTFESLMRNFPKIGKWQAGESQPSLRQLESLAKVTRTPLGFFFLAEPPEERLPVPHFRTLKNGQPSKPSPDLLESVQLMQRRQAWMREFLLEQGQGLLPFVRSATPDEPSLAVAERIRLTLRFDENWAARETTWTNALGILGNVLEAAGILVFCTGIVGNNTHRKLNPNEFRGFVLVDDIAPLVFINGADGKAAQMFTLAHELAHVFFGSSAAFDLREMQPADDPMEQACNRVAAEFLVPESQLRRTWSSHKMDPERFQAIARQFKVSALVAARRALDLNLIQKSEFLDFYNSYQQDERRAAAQRPEGGDFYASQNVRVGRRFGHAVVRAVKEGKLLYSDAYRLTGLHGRAFERYSGSLDLWGPQ